MSAFSKIDMANVTRLTREGRLKEAMALLRGTRPTESPANEAQATHDQAGTQRFGLGAAFRGMLDSVGPLRFGRGRGAPAGTVVRDAAQPLPDGARFDLHAYTSAAGSRPYKLYIPSGYDGRALPLLVMLHGCTQSPDDFAAGTGMNELAEELGFFVAYPAQTPAANSSNCWNWFRPGDQRRDRGEPALIAGITREIIGTLAVAPGRVYVAGLSAGGAAAAIMGSAYPDLYAAIGVHSGLACGAASDVASALTAMRNGSAAVANGPRRHRASGGTIPTIVFHGDHDKTVSHTNGDQVIAQSIGEDDLRVTVSRGEAAGGMRYTRTVQADASGRPVLEQWVLHGAGHAWSGGNAKGTYADPNGPDASREMLRFFLQHRARTD